MSSEHLGMTSMFELPPRARPGPAELPKARDVGTQTREFHAWTMRKLEVLTAYLKMYRRVAGGGTYIDAFAGSGQARIKGDLTAGSPLRALRSGAFRDLVLFEKDPKIHADLCALVGSLEERDRLKVRIWNPPADCNEAIIELLEAGGIDKDRPCFAFLDPNSTELEWATVERLARYKPYEAPPPGEQLRRCKVELWILVNTHHALGRLMPSDRTSHRVPPHAHVLDSVMGGREAWWDLWLRSWGGPDLLASRYAERLQTELGYRWAHAQRVHDPDTNRVQYYMVHASDHPNAHTLMRSAKKEKFVDPPQLAGMGPRPNSG